MAMDIGNVIEKCLKSFQFRNQLKILQLVVCPRAKYNYYIQLQPIVLFKKKKWKILTTLLCNCNEKMLI